MAALRNKQKGIIMKESTFLNEFYNIAKKVIPKEFIIKTKSNILYELMLNDKLEIQIKEFKNPKRGNSAFQTDICIYELINDIELPRVVIEFKTDITTHDILTYSSKAGKHKNIYPYLRYGLLASEIDNIPGRFFIHNEHIDFFIAIKKYRNEDISKMIKELIENEIEISRTLEKIHFYDKKFDYYRNEIVFKNYK